MLGVHVRVGCDVSVASTKAIVVAVDAPHARSLTHTKALRHGEEIPADRDITPDKGVEGEQLIDERLGLLLGADEGDRGTDECLPWISPCVSSK
jgi:hypothetical protein